MSFFRRNKLKLSVEKKKEGQKLVIDFGALKDPSEFKFKLLGDIIGTNKCFAVLDTRLLYNNDTTKNDELAENVSKTFEELSVNYKKTSLRKLKDIGVFGAKIHMESTAYYEYCFGFIMDSTNLLNLKQLIDIYNIHYFIPKNEEDSNKFLEDFSVDYTDLKYKYKAYVDNFVTRFVVEGPEDFINKVKDDLRGK